MKTSYVLPQSSPFFSYLLVSLLLVTFAQAVSARPVEGNRAGLTSQERQCIEQGWRRVTMDIAGQQRELLWKGPDGAWSKGAIIAMHGGGGQHFQWCTPKARLVAPQVRFSNQAIAEGFAVFLLNSSDQVTDTNGRPCGKIWDDEVRQRANLDLPFIGRVIRSTMPDVRPRGSRTEVFLTGLSSGGYMTVRAATHFNDLITAFAPVSSGDPYGWHRICEPGLTGRRSVHGAGFDNETGKQIIEYDSCLSPYYPNEKPWDGQKRSLRPAFRVFRHEMDGINDKSCSEKISRQLRVNGYPGEADFVLRGGRRSLLNHLWQDAYNRPILDFFSRQLGSKQVPD